MIVQLKSLFNTKGDSGLLIFSKFPLDGFITGANTPYDVLDDRLFSLTDAVFIPGIVNISIGTDIATGNNLVIKHDKALIELNPTGKFKIKNTTTGNELVDLTQQLADKVATSTITVPPGGVGGTFFLSNAVAINAIATKIANLVG